MVLASCDNSSAQNAAEADRKWKSLSDEIQALKAENVKAIEAQREFVGALAVTMDKRIADAVDRAEKDRQAAETRAEAERTARAAYEAQLVEHIRELAAKVTDLTQAQKDQIIADTQPFTPPARTPDEIEADRRREEEKEKQEEEQRQMMLALLAIFFSPILAAILGAMTAKEEGLSDEESEEFAEHLATGKPLTKPTAEKVARSKTLSDVDKRVTTAREQDPDPGKPRTPTPAEQTWLKEIGAGKKPPPLPQTKAAPPPVSSDKKK